MRIAIATSAKDRATGMTGILTSMTTHLKMRATWTVAHIVMERWLGYNHNRTEYTGPDGIL